MKKLYFIAFLGIIMALGTNAQPSYKIVPGTVSPRLDGSNNPAIVDTGTDPITDRRYYSISTYFGSDNGGARTSWNSSQFLDFALFKDPNAATSDFPVLIENETNQFFGQLGGFQTKWKLNYRMAYPTAFDSAAWAAGTDNTLYPVIIMMHGAGERGDCWNNNCYSNNPNNYKNLYNNDHNVYHGGKQHLDAINFDPVNPRHWPGFAVFPQNKDGYQPSINENFGYTMMITELVENLPDWYPVDRNRIYVHGLSNGAEACWMLIQGRPDLFAATAPMSGHKNHTFISGSDTPPMEETMVHIPLWQFQGGRDRKPSPGSTDTKMKNLRQVGGTPRYTIYPNIGHGTWNTAYNEPDFFSWFLQYSKLSIHSFYGITEVCEGDPINVKLGISPGFTSYEWRKVIGTDSTVVTPISGRPHEIIADELANYIVRFARGTEWTEWSDPFELSSRPRSEVTITALGPTVLNGLDGSTETTLQGPSTGTELYYEWYNNGVIYLEDSTSNEITVSEDGNFTLVVTDGGLCKSFVSNSISVSVAPYGPDVPQMPGNFHALTSNENTINVFWDDNSTNELGFELYRATSPGGPYTFVANVPAGDIQYADNGLNASTLYYYVMRAFNSDGASAATPEASATTDADSSPPTAPTNVVFEKFNYTTYEIDIGDPDGYVDQHFEVHLDQPILSWSPASDNVGVTEYEVYHSNGGLIGTTADTSYTITGLTEEQTYSFYIVAKDGTNSSVPSNTVTVTTSMTGLYANVYGGGTWDYVHEYSRWAIFGSGTATNFSWSAKNSITPTYSDNDYFAYDFMGYVYIETGGTYTFRLNSDDGSQLWIGSTMVIDNDGLHGCGNNPNNTGSISLSPGAYPITMKMFERTGGQCIDLDWWLPGASGYTNFPSSALRSSDYPTPSPPATPGSLLAAQDPGDFNIDLTWNFNHTYTVVVLGSSTAAGTGATSTATSWVGLLDTWLGTHTDTYTLHNLAVGGYNTYHIRADGTSGGGYSADENANITEAIDLGADIILVNMPSNNIAVGIDIPTTMSHYDEIKALADAAGIKIFFTTTQPRNFGNQSQRELLEDEANAVRAAFGNHVIDIYDELTNFADYRIKTEYNSGDGIHLNDAGHAYLFSEVLNTVGPHFVKTEIYRSDNSSGPYAIVGTTDYGVETFSDTGLNASTTYYYQAKSVNIDGQSGFSNSTSATTIADTDPPTIPGNVTVESYTHESVAISWSPSSDNVGVSQYMIYENGNPVGGTRTLAIEITTTSSTAVTITGLSPSSTYNFSVSAMDAGGNESSQSPQVQVTTDAGPLPVEFLDFKAVTTSQGVLLRWSTASEENNLYFTVERSDNLSDFISIGSIDGAGNSTEIRNYEFLDRNPLDVGYYRIKQTDIDGKFDYSVTIVVNSENGFDITLYPNPTSSDNINLKGRINSSLNKATIQLVDSYGKIHLQNQIVLGDLESGIRIQPNVNMRPGIYMVVIYGVNKVHKYKLLIK